MNNDLIDYYKELIDKIREALAMPDCPHNQLALQVRWLRDGYERLQAASAQSTKLKMNCKKGINADATGD